MMELATLVLMIGGTLGFGAAVLSALRIRGGLPPGESHAWSFAVGFGLLGWLVGGLGFMDGLAPWALGLLLGVGLPGLWLLRDMPALPRPDPWGWALLGVLAGVMGMDLIEALAPPSDADTLAYHFALPKLYLEAGGIFFVPRAIDGAAPLLSQMTYLPALALGGERALTLWTMTGNWATAALLFAISRRFIDFNWSLGAALVYLTVPAVIYGGGSGQVEVRNALYVLLGAFSVGLALRTGLLRYAALAGLMAGFFAGAKYLGLIFVLSCGLTLMAQRRWFVQGLAFSLAAVIAGGGWYVWIWSHTGDPVFPMLFTALGLPDGPYWSRAFDAFFRERAFFGETPLGHGLWAYLGYPFVATLDAPPIMEARRTGFGPFGWLILPFALAGIWGARKKLRSSPLAGVALVSFLFFTIWFFMSPTQRVRFLLPLLPGLILCLSVAAVKFSNQTKAARKPLAAAFALTIAFQVAGAALFTRNPAQYLLTGESRNDYLERTVTRFAPVAWLNENLGPNDKVLHTVRQYNYLLDVPYFFANTYAQKIVDLSPGRRDPRRFLRQIKAEGVTHLIFSPNDGSSLGRYIETLKDAGCLKTVRRFDNVAVFPSRTLRAGPRRTEPVNLYELTAVDCDKLLSTATKPSPKP